MTARSSKTEKALRLVRRRGTLRPRDLAERNIPPDYLDRLHRRGLIERIGWGLYACPGGGGGPPHSPPGTAPQGSPGVPFFLSAPRLPEVTPHAPPQGWGAPTPRAGEAALARPPP